MSRTRFCDACHGSGRVHDAKRALVRCTACGGRGLFTERICPDCGGRHDIFGHGGAKAEAEKLGVPFLGEILLHGKIRELSDLGTPIVIADPESEQAKAYCDLANAVMSNIDQAQKPAPRISMED